MQNVGEENLYFIVQYQIKDKVWSNHLPNNVLGMSTLTKGVATRSACWTRTQRVLGCIQMFLDICVNTILAVWYQIAKPVSFQFISIHMLNHLLFFWCPSKGTFSHISVVQIVPVFLSLEGCQFLLYRPCPFTSFFATNLFEEWLALKCSDISFKFKSQVEDKKSGCPLYQFLVGRGPFASSRLSFWLVVFTPYVHKSDARSSKQIFQEYKHLHRVFMIFDRIRTDHITTHILNWNNI